MHLTENYHHQINDLQAQLADAKARAERVDRELAALRLACSRENEEICQTLGLALGYPKFADDQAAFLGATDADGVCVGPHVAATLAMEAAERIEKLQESLAHERLLVEQARQAKERRATWARNVLEYSGQPTVSQPRMPVDNRSDFGVIDEEVA